MRSSPSPVSSGARQPRPVRTLQSERTELQQRIEQLLLEREQLEGDVEAVAT
jgi:hypothetical protein